METVAILIPSLKKGGAEKQAVLLKNALSSNYKILFILFNAELGCEEELLKLGDFKDNTLIKIQGRLIKKNFTIAPDTEKKQSQISLYLLDCTKFLW